MGRVHVGGGAAGVGDMGGGGRVKRVREAVIQIIENGYSISICFSFQLFPWYREGLGASCVQCTWYALLHC